MNNLTTQDIKGKKLIYLYDIINQYDIKDLKLNEGHVYEAYWQLVFILNKEHYHKLKSYTGKLEKNELEKIDNIKSFITSTNINQSCGDGIADIKLKYINGKYIFITSKYHMKEKSYSQLDISNISQAADHINITDYEIWVFVKDKEKLKNTKNSEYIHKYVAKSLDENDLRRELQVLKNNWSPIDEYLYELNESFSMTP